MRRKSNRSSAKSTPEAKIETRKSTRSSRRRKSPSVELEDKTNSTNVEENIIDNNPEKLSGSVTNTPEGNKKEEENIDPPPADGNVENEDRRGHTPPCVDSTGNEATKIDEVDAEKGKSKGISKTEVEENSEIQMNSVVTCSPEEEINNEVNPDVGNISKEGNDELKENQIVDSPIESNINSDAKFSCNNEEQEIRAEIPESCDVETCEKTESDDNCKEDLKNSESVNNVSVEDKTDSVNTKHSTIVDDDQAEEGEIRDTKSDEENEKSMNESSTKRAKKVSVKIKLRRDSLFDLIESEDKSPAKRIKWDSQIHDCIKIFSCDLHRLNVEDFKSFSSDLKLAEESEVKLEEIYQPKISRERVKSMDASSEEIERPEYSKQNSTVSSDDQETTNIIALNRKISIVDDGASKLKPPPSPSKQPSSQILFISNLVRPFTLKQLKELLERTGTIKEGGFWTDRIKSKCYVWYDSVEEAEATRNALHGVNWPVGNGKKLIIDFATEEQMEKARNPPAPPVPPTPQPVQQTPPPRSKTPPKEIMEDSFEHRNGDRREDRKRKDSEREKERAKLPYTREWDVGKENNKERARSRSRDRRRRHSGKRSPTPLEDFIARKTKKLEESVPQKLMDDLFQRTKAMPCIYWQPLSPEEISVKQQQRLSRMEEHKRRLEENSRNRGFGARDRGSYRRRYD